MRITRIRVKNFRSIFDDGGRSREVLRLAPRGNYIVGPNNSGKSNIIRALQLALRPEGRRRYDPSTDIPKQKTWAYPTVTLDFKMHRKRGPYKTLLKYVDKYERSVKGADKKTFASEDRVRFHVQYTTERGSRQDLFLASGAGSRKGDQDKLEKALAQFRKVIRLVDIESGEDLQSLLQRGFNELFATVLSERFGEEIEAARAQRRDYKEHLTSELLGPVADFIASELPNHVPAVEGVRIDPSIEDLEEALGQVDVHMNDGVETPLRLKGTGVRAAVIQMFMSFIAESSRRAVVFAIEEPEVFLHPQGHSSLGRELESFTKRSDISLIATTHSPFILARDSDARVFMVSRRASGQTIVERADDRETTIREARALLTGSPAVPTVLGIIDSIPDEAQAVLVVEGTTDERYLQAATDVSGRGLLEDIHIVPSEGAHSAVKDAVVLRAVFEDSKEVYVLLDDDDVGRKAYVMATDKLRFQGRSEVSKYSRWQPKYGQDVEAEDLFCGSLIDGFLDKFGNDVLDGYMVRNNNEGKHFDIAGTAKDDFAKWVEENASVSNCDQWIQLLEDVRSYLGLKAAT